MSANYQLAERAVEELDEILAYVAEQNSVERALRVHVELTQTFERLASMPKTGTKRPELTGDHVRWCVVFRWLVLYDPEISPVTILRIMHGSRDISILLDE